MAKSINLISYEELFMLIAISKYTKPLHEVDAYRQEHQNYLKALFSAGKLLVTGRQNPAAGGVIIAKSIEIEEFKNILDHDPFTVAGVAEYKITEFQPSFYDHILAEMFNK